jgi:alpha-galactosidase/6-phospho-beta-glucosidase family protein
LETRLKQLLEENELLAQEVRDMPRVKKERRDRKKQKKERKNKEKKARLRAEIVREAMRLMTAILTPLPEGSLARVMVVAVEALFLWKMEESL